MYSNLFVAVLGVDVNTAVSAGCQDHAGGELVPIARRQ